MLCILLILTIVPYCLLKLLECYDYFIVFLCLYDYSDTTVFMCFATVAVEQSNGAMHGQLTG